MIILSSTIDSQVTQIDGRISVTERHIYDDGAVYLHSYIAEANFNLQEVADARAANMNAELAIKAQQTAEAANFEIPLTKTEFRERFTLVEQITIDNFNATYKDNPALTAGQKAAILSALQHWADTTRVYLSHAKTQSTVAMYEALGLIAAGRAAEVLS